MDRDLSASRHWILGLLVSVLLCSCHAMSGVQFAPSSHFAFPNANVVPIGHATGEASRTSFMIPEIFNADLEEQAYTNALTASGGDLIIDVTKYYEVTSIFIIYITTLRVEGTAAVMEVGEQELR